MIDSLIALVLASGYAPAALKPWAVSWEVLGVREPFDAGIVADRMREPTPPRLTDAGKFPSRAIVLNAIAFNRNHAAWIRGRAASEPWREDLAEWVRANDRCYDFWDLIRDAQAEYLYVWGRRRALANARDLIGPRNWHLNIFPAYAPFYWFYDER